MSTNEPLTYVVGDGPVRLEVTAGEGQKAKIAVRVNGVEVARATGRVTVNIPASAEGTRVESFTVVNHTNPQSTRFSVTHDWSGGLAPRTDVFEGDFATDPNPSFVEPIYILVAAE